MTGQRIYETINFVPEWYVQKQVRQTQRRHMTIAMCALVGVMLAISALAWRQVDGLNQYYTSLDEQVRAVNNQLSEVSKLQAARRTLTDELRVYTELARPIGMHQISSAIANVTPDSVFLESMKTETEHFNRTEVVVPAHETKNGRAITKTEEYDIIEVTITGASPNDVEIANYVGKLASINLFRNVKMRYSREKVVDDSVIREFKITMQIPLDRDYQVAKPQEVADAAQ